MKHLNTLGVLLLSAHLLLQLLRGLPLCQSIIVTRVTLSSLLEGNVFARVVSCWSAPPKIGDCWMRKNLRRDICTKHANPLSNLFCRNQFTFKMPEETIFYLRNKFPMRRRFKKSLPKIVFSPYLPISLFISQKVFRVPALKPTVNSSSRFDFFKMKKNHRKLRQLCVEAQY